MSELRKMIRGFCPDKEVVFTISARDERRGEFDEWNEVTTIHGKAADTREFDDVVQILIRGEEKITERERL